MALDPGSVSVDPTTGDVSGAGYARQLYDAEAAANATLAGTLDAGVAMAFPGSPPATYRPILLGWRQNMAAKCNALAAAQVALLQSATVTTVVPSTPGTYVGTVT